MSLQKGKLRHRAVLYITQDLTICPEKRRDSNPSLLDSKPTLVSLTQNLPEDPLKGAYLPAPLGHGGGKVGS